MITPSQYVTLICRRCGFARDTLPQAYGPSADPVGTVAIITTCASCYDSTLKTVIEFVDREGRVSKRE